MRIKGLFALGILTTFLFIACGGGQTTTTDTNGGDTTTDGGQEFAGTLKIGVAGPMTGDQAKMGQDLKNGVTLAVNEWNAKGGLLGNKIEVIWGDDQHDPKQAISVANKFITEGVIGVVGHFNSACSIPVSSTYHDAGLVQITPASTNPQFTDQGLPNVFRVCGRDDQQGRVGAEYTVKHMPDANVAVVHDKTTYGQGLADEFKKSYTELSGKDVVYYGGITPGEMDYKPILTNVKSAEPALIYFGGIYPDGGLLVRQAKELGMDAIWMSGDGVIDQEFVKIAGAEAAEGTLLSFTPDQTKLEGAQDVIKRYEAEFGVVGPYSLYSYSAANILLTGIEKSGTTEMLAVADAIRSQSHPTVFGEIAFDEKGDITESPYVIWTTHNGDFIEVGDKAVDEVLGAMEAAAEEAPAEPSK